MDVDYMANGNLPPIKEYHNCVSGYAWNANTTLEAVISATEGTSPLQLSVQHPLDCSDA